MPVYFKTSPWCFYIRNCGSPIKESTYGTPGRACTLFEVSVLFTINSQTQGQEKTETLAQPWGDICLWTLLSSSHHKLLLQLLGRYSSFYVTAELLLDTSQSLVTGELRLYQSLTFHAEVFFEIVHPGWDNNRHKLLFPLDERQSDCLRWSF